MVMKRVNYVNKGEKILTALAKIIEEGENLGLQLKGAKEKARNLGKVLDEKKIKVALIGRVSDGKTSILAAMLGCKTEDMKIGIGETSDQLQSYVIDSMGTGIEFVDTPGLFGTKEKEIDGDHLQISSLTEKFLSEAHIILYICDARTPIKNVHESLIFDILRKYNKLGTTIFVLNKMDDVCDLEDEEDFRDMKDVKTKWLIEGLEKAIQLTDEEKSQLKYVCISADPNRKGIDFWLANENNSNYEKLSRVSSLRKIVESLLNSSDENKLHESNLMSIRKDILRQIDKQADQNIAPTEEKLSKFEETCEVARGDFNSIQNSLLNSKSNLRDQLESERLRVLNDIDGATIDSMSEMMDKNFGTLDADQNFGSFVAHIDKVFEDVLGSSMNLDVQCQNNVKLLNTDQGFFEKLFNKYGGQVGNLKIDNNMVKSGRDLIAPSFKFRPWGAVKFAENINKGLGGLALVVEGIQLWREHKAEKALAELKKQLKEYVGAYFNQLNQVIRDDEQFYRLTPSFLVFRELLNQKNKELEEVKAQLKDLQEYQEKVKKSILTDIEDVDFEEID